MMAFYRTYLGMLGYPCFGPIGSFLHVVCPFSVRYDASFEMVYYFNYSPNKSE